MELYGWITLGAVIVALGLGVASILHTQSLKKRERKERLLNEIIEWAIDVSKCGLDINISIFNGLHRAKDVKEMEFIKNTATLDLLSAFLVVNARSEYISKMAFIFGQNLNRAIFETVESINEHIELLRKSYEDEDKKKIKASSDDIGKHRNQLIKSAQKVIEEATKIKTKDIS